MAHMSEQFIPSDCSVFRMLGEEEAAETTTITVYEAVTEGVGAAVQEQQAVKSDTSALPFDSLRQAGAAWNKVVGSLIDSQLGYVRDVTTNMQQAAVSRTVPQPTVPKELRRLTRRGEAIRRVRRMCLQCVNGTKPSTGRLDDCFVASYLIHESMEGRTPIPPRDSETTQTSTAE